MKLFLGEYDHALDERSRLMLPRKIRQEIEAREIVLARGYDGCIFGFDIHAWEKEAQKHLETPVTDQKAREVRRYLFSGAEKVEMDKLGRIVLPQTLKVYAVITRDIKVVGAGDHFELWDTKRWVEYEKGLKGA